MLGTSSGSGGIAGVLVGVLGCWRYWLLVWCWGAGCSQDAGRGWGGGVLVGALGASGSARVLGTSGDAGGGAGLLVGYWSAWCQQGCWLGVCPCWCGYLVLGDNVGARVLHSSRDAGGFLGASEGPGALAEVLGCWLCCYGASEGIGVLAVVLDVGGSAGRWRGHSILAGLLGCWSVCWVLAELLAGVLRCWLAGGAGMLIAGPGC